MNSVGFIISEKENENRRALLPSDIIKNVVHREFLFFQKGYGEVLGITDNEYLKIGCNIVDRAEILEKDVICDPKVGDGDYINYLKENQKIFGWIHATRNRDITDAILNTKSIAYAFENMYNKSRHSFWKNNELAGEASVMHAFTLYGDIPMNKKVAVIGNGNTSRGAVRVLISLGADVTIYTRKDEVLFKEEMYEYDVIVNALLWDFFRKDHLICKEDLPKLKPNALIIDISCDRSGAVETSIPTTIEKPVYVIDGIMHYVVDHTPALLYKTATKSISEEVSKYIDCFVEGTERNNAILKNALILDRGIIVDNNINIFQERK